MTSATLPSSTAPACQPGAPVLLGIIGPPGAGKSTMVAMLARATAAPVFRLRETVRARPDLRPDSHRVPTRWMTDSQLRHRLSTLSEMGVFTTV